MKKILLISIVMLIGASAVKGQLAVDQAKAKFIYNFTKFFEWPQSERSGDFVIGVLGSDQVYRELDKYTEGKKVIVQPISVVKYKKIDEVEDCQAIYISKFRSKDIDNIHNKVGNHTLVISDSNDGIESGAALNFVLHGNRLRFEFSGDNALKMGLKFSSRIKEMAVNN